MPSTGSWSRYGQHASLGMLTVALCSVLVCCAPEGSAYRDLSRLDGLLVADDGIYVVPDRHWRREGKFGGSFRKTASYLVLIRSDRPESLRVTCTPDESTARFHFTAKWDDDLIWQNQPSATGGVIEVEVGRAALTPGLHRLSLDRNRRDDDVVEREDGRSVFSQVDVRLSEDGTERPLRITPNSFLASYLDFGVASQTRSKLSGCLFLGPQTHTFPMVADGDTDVSLILENRSRSNARFEVSIDDKPAFAIDLEANDRAPVRFSVLSGRHVVTFVVSGAANGCFLWGAPHARQRSTESLAPVVLITLDTTRRDVVEPFGGRSGLTPNLRRLSELGTTYTNAYATSPWTLPSHASIFTGLYPSNHRAGVYDDALSESVVSLAERLRQQGYLTGGFAGGPMASSEFGLAQGFSVFQDPRSTEEPANVITDAAIEFVEDNLGTPLFLFLNYFDPHGPYDAPESFQDRLGVGALGDAILETPGWGSYVREEAGSWSRIRDGDVEPTKPGLAYLRARYEAEVAFMDDQIGRFFDHLRRRNLFDNALIVIVADHGEFLGERGLFSHSYRLDRELTAVPLVIKWPHQRGSEVVDDLVSQVDLYGAIASAVGVDVPPGDGVVFSKGRTDGLRRRELVFLEEHSSRIHQLNGRFKIADHLFGMQWLDVRDVFFPGFIECSQRRDSAWIPDLCHETWDSRLRDLPAAMQATLEIEADHIASDLDEETADKLRALGYLE